MASSSFFVKKEPKKLLRCDAGALRPVTAMHRRCMAVTGLPPRVTAQKFLRAFF
jgi:hypothetical protein